MAWMSLVLWQIPLRSPFIAGVKRRLREGALTRNLYRTTGSLVSYVKRIPDRIRYGRSYPVTFFDRLFARDGDPWSYDGDLVSEQRRGLLLNTISARSASRLLEIGCASGWMTASLGLCVDEITAIDISPVALSLARERCKTLGNVDFQCLDILSEDIPGTYDVVLCAGVLVYLPWHAQRDVLDRIVNAVAPGGLLVLEHTCHAFDIGVAGKQVHDLYCNHPNMTVSSRIQREIYEVVALERSRPGSH